MTKRPSDLKYAVDEYPPLFNWGLLGLQQVCIIAIYLVIVVIIARISGASEEVSQQLVSSAMIASAIAAVLQSLHKGPVGSGYLAPPVISAIYLQASILAINSGGLPVLFGMTIFAGLCEIVFAKILPYFRYIFTPIVSGFIVMAVGIELGIVGTKLFLDITKGWHNVLFSHHITLAIITLSLMVSLTVMEIGKLRLYSVIISILIGSVLGYFLGVIPETSIQMIQEAKWFSLIHFDYVSYSFNPMLIIPFLMSSIAAALRTTGVVTTCQKMNDDDWRRPKMHEIQKGILADGLGTTIGGLLGVPGMSSAPSCVGISHATGATSRCIAYAIGAFLFIFAFIPKIAVLVTIIPHAVIGAALIYTGSIMLIGGIKIITNYPINVRKTFIIGISLLLGLSHEAFPTFYDSLPPSVQIFTGTMLSISTLSAILLSALFRFGIRRTATTMIDASTNLEEKFESIIIRSAKEWGARPEDTLRAVEAAKTLLRLLNEGQYNDTPVTAKVSFDDCSYLIDLYYEGDLLKLPQHRPFSVEELVDEAPMTKGLSGFLIDIYPDKVVSNVEDTTCHIQMKFILQ
jgi:xanthine permease XanP